MLMHDEAHVSRSLSKCREQHHQKVQSQEKVDRLSGRGESAGTWSIGGRRSLPTNKLCERLDEIVDEMRCCLEMSMREIGESRSRSVGLTVSIRG